MQCIRAQQSIAQPASLPSPLGILTDSLPGPLSCSVCAVQELKKEIASLRAALLARVQAAGQATVFSHNDLLSGNVMWEEKSGAIRLIDFEYGCYGYRGFDMGNHFCECCGFECDWSKFPDKATQSVFLRGYLTASKQAQVTATAAGKKPTAAAVSGKESSEAVVVSDAAIDALYAEVAPWVLVSHLFWGTWGVVQAQHSVIDFDYVQYATMRFQGYRLMKDHALSFLKPTASAPAKK
jgi:ethanolamine kinase